MALISNKKWAGGGPMARAASKGAERSLMSAEMARVIPAPVNLGNYLKMTPVKGASACSDGENWTLVS